MPRWSLCFASKLVLWQPNVRRGRKPIDTNKRQPTGGTIKREMTDLERFSANLTLRELKSSLGIVVIAFNEFFRPF